MTSIDCAITGWSHKGGGGGGDKQGTQYCSLLAGPYRGL